jgi:hypothetical protein
VARRKGEIQSSVGRPAGPTEGAVEAVACVEKLKNRRNLNDSVLARLVGVDQSSVHRALSRRPPRLTPTLLKLCNYAEKNLKVDGTHHDDDAKAQLTKAVASVWDGSAEGLNKLLTLLRNLGDLVSRD